MFLSIQSVIAMAGFQAGSGLNCFQHRQLSRAFPRSPAFAAANSSLLTLSRRAWPRPLLRQSLR